MDRPGSEIGPLPTLLALSGSLIEMLLSLKVALATMPKPFSIGLTRFSGSDAVSSRPLSWPPFPLYGAVKSPVSCAGGWPGCGT